MSFFQAIPQLNRRTGKPLALSTIRKRITKILRTSGYKIKRIGNPNRIVAEELMRKCDWCRGEK